ncbi:hypothetical protein PABG_03589 [Paracoccidioides brasiliensis Pb03]|uniref:C2H2-type domain-containing protein n=1 Tax=Paracoccidioides brasiliensis (strain Pb18) TaxID=502780 RepID=C1G060_PARBD|nr:uncharacterized protein PADG_00250 [Paracoccidioides brasiliensis Pb18]EEH21373.1 hypothetical protein PABG_03589 [Paracoccidioides brasiliensis Pb03]EEH43961.2 hypothetical protein PADG_00250 [Paracoccidioides brasiliensis Pb18]ODH50472.1 hypothetical protein GX48_03433 [Paracoccidioides brasiliensis]
MPPRGFTNPAPKTESARSALTSFTCTLCSKSYSRHPEYEAHIGSYDHQHRKRLRDLKQLSRDPQAAERARRDERKRDEEAGIVRVESEKVHEGGKPEVKGPGGGGGGFKKGGFKSSFTAVGTGGSAAVGVGKVKKNPLGEDEDEDEGGGAGGEEGKRTAPGGLLVRKGNLADAESETDDEDGSGYYDPRKPTGCFEGCGGVGMTQAV